MTVELFMTKLQGRFPKLKENAVIRGDIEDGLKKYSERALDKLWTEFLNEYVYDRTPRWANIYHIARNADIGRKASTGFSFFRCNKCGAAFSLEAAYCPACKSLADNVTVVAGKRPEKFFESRQDCGICKHYLKNDSGKMCGGPFCASFGTEDTGHLKQCRDCLCRFCCFETWAMREAADGRPEKLQRLAREDRFEDRLNHRHKSA